MAGAAANKRQSSHSLAICFWAVIYLFVIINLLDAVKAAEDQSDKLIFVQPVWRHGDRSPTATFKSDTIKEEDWPQGWGQLTTRGMAQHVTLGKRLRQKYILDQKLVSENYKNHEIYVRSTDVNRTLTSAISNFIGFYGDSAKAGVDYPLENWPAKFVPIAIHTVDTHNDHIGNADPHCPRRKKVMGLWKETPEYKQLVKEKQWVFDNLTKFCDQEIGVDNFWIVADALYIENLWNLTLPKWATPELMKEINHTNCLLEAWSSGRYMQPYNGVDFSLELPKMRGGGLIWALINQMQDKVNCLKAAKTANSTDQLSDMCQWMNKLKYYVFSVKTNYDTDGYPHYSACVTVELWQKPDSTSYVKVLYWIPDSSENIDMTTHIVGCEKNCTLEQFAQRSLPYKAEPSPEEYCKNLDLGLSSSAFANTCYSSICLIGITLLINIVGVLYRQ